MWVSPESGQTWTQIADTVWRNLTPEGRARVEAVMTAKGWTREDFCQEMHKQFQEELAEAENDPTCEFAKQLDMMAFPCGHDPWLTRTEPPSNQEGG